MNECNNLERTTTIRSLTINQAEESTHFVPESDLMPFLCDYPRKHCKEIDLAGNEPNLFVIVSAEEEKRFALEHVKEFRVSSSVFDQMVPTFEAFTSERFSRQMGFLFDQSREFSSTLRVSLCSQVFDMFRAKIKYALFRTWPELECLLRNLLIEPCELKNHELELNHSKMPLGALGNENMLDYLRKLFAYSKRTFDVVSLVFEKEKQVKDLRAKVIQFLSNQVDYGPRQQLSYHFKFWNWKYLRKETPKRGSITVFKRTRREDDQRFKPPDLVQIRHLNLHLFIQIKEEPPDATSKPKTRLHIFGGNFLVLVHFLITNLLYFHADNLDLRSNPFQEGGDDVILASSTSNSISTLDRSSSSSTSSLVERGNGYGTKDKSDQKATHSYLDA